jgi:hypothetical protein
MTTRSTKPVLHTVITPDGVTHSRKSPRTYAVAIVIEYHPVTANRNWAERSRAEAAEQITLAEKYELEALTAPAVRTESKVPSGYGYDRTVYHYPPADLLGWADKARKHAANHIANSIKQDAAAANPDTKPTFCLIGWSQTEDQGHKTARTTLNKCQKYSGKNNGAIVRVLPATRHG